ncbi:MAG: hypothetical protein M0P01_10350 [Treponema sp.]|nr:hypothetical protein [Treponema sp.]
MKLIKYLLTASVFLSVMFLSACTASIEIRRGSDGNTSVAYDAEFGNAFVEMMKSLSEENSGPLFDIQTITGQFEEAGIPGVNVSSKSDTSLKISALLPRGSKDSVSVSGCISGTADSISLTISPEKLSALYTSLPETVKSYIDLFMAPVFNGDTMTPAEYTDLISSVYGKSLGDEVAAAQVNIILYGPGGNGKKKTVTVPLTDILTASKPLLYTVTW